MNIGIGYSQNTDSFRAGQEVIQMAQKNDEIKDIGLVLAFCTKHIEQTDFVRGMASQLPESTPIVGSTTIGIINNEIVRYIKPISSALILGSNSLVTHIATAELTGDNEETAGAEIAEHMGCGEDDKFLFLFYNMVKKERHHHTAPKMNSLLSILKGMEQKRPIHAPIFGAGSLGDYDFSSSKIFDANQASSNLLIGISFCGDFYFDNVVMHGCMPIDGIYHTITKCDGTMILELDGQPAIDVINETFGDRDWQRELPVKELTIGVNYGVKFGPYKEENYVNRLIAGPHLFKKAIVTPEPDWQPGQEIQFMIRDTEEMLKSTMERSEALLQKTIAAGKTPKLGLYIDCAGRTAYFSNSLQEESALVQQIFNKYNVPLFGFFSGLEIAPFFHKSRGLEWTGVLVVLAEN